jgi:hypothetical protein
MGHRVEISKDLIESLAQGYRESEQKLLTCTADAYAFEERVIERASFKIILRNESNRTPFKKKRISRLAWRKSISSEPDGGRTYTNPSRESHVLLKRLTFHGFDRSWSMVSNDGRFLAEQKYWTSYRVDGDEDRFRYDMTLVKMFWG